MMLTSKYLQMDLDRMVELEPQRYFTRKKGPAPSSLSRPSWAPQESITPSRQRRWGQSLPYGSLKTRQLQSEEKFRSTRTTSLWSQRSHTQRRPQDNICTIHYAQPSKEQEVD